MNLNRFCFFLYNYNKIKKIKGEIFYFISRFDLICFVVVVVVVVVFTYI